MSNIFARYGKQVLTPKLSLCGVSGVTRERLISQLPLLNLSVSEEALSLSQLMQADEIFICNSLFGVWQVTRFNGKTWAKQSLANDLNLLLLK
jgi:4-amino-4-deoxychorismate lyase